MTRIIRKLNILLIFVLSISLFAQSTETYKFAESSVIIDYPTMLTLVESDDGSIELSTDGLILTVYDPIALETVFELTFADSAEDALVEVAPQMLDDFDVDNVTTDSVDERDIARFDVEADDENSALIMVTLSDGSYGLIQAVSTSMDGMDDEMLMELIATFDRSGGLSLDLDLEAISDAFCNVSASKTDNVQVRVGPGTNRTVVSFLPANIEFAVLGKSQADDGSLWFKLNKEEAAPNKAVNETWILADSVTQVGDCDAVADAAAPPIIPIIVQPTPNPEGGDEEAVASAIKPQSGTWRMTAGNVFISCPSGASTSLPSNMPPETLRLTGGGESPLRWGGDVFAKVGLNTYSYSTPLVIQGDIIDATINLIVTSETQITGSFIFAIQGCQATAPINMEHV